MTKLSVPAAAIVLLSSLLASSSASSTASSQPKRLRTIDVHRSGARGVVIDGGQPRKVGDGDDRRLQFPAAELVGSMMSSSISLPGSISVSGELGFGPVVVVVVPTTAPVESTIVTLGPTIILDDAESLSMSFPDVEDETASPTPAVTEAVTTFVLPPVTTTLPPVMPTPPPVVATPPPVVNLFGTTAPPTAGMSMPEMEDLSMSLPDEDDAASPPPTPFVTMGSPPSFEAESTSSPKTPSPVTPAPVPVPELLPANAEGSRYVHYIVCAVARLTLSEMNCRSSAEGADSFPAVPYSF